MSLSLFSLRVCCLCVVLQCKAFPGCLGPEVAEAAAAAQGRSGVVFSVGMALDVSQRDRLVALLREQVGGLQWSASWLYMAVLQAAGCMCVLAMQDA
jgi:hypothetical protein